MADYSYYFGKLAGLDMMAYVDTPMPGFYRTKDGTPVAFFPNQVTVPGAAFDVPTTEGDVIGVRFDRADGGPMKRRDLSKDQAAQLWNWACGSPVKEADWRNVVAGGSWHDEAPGLGHNQPEAEETVEQRAERLAGLAEAWLQQHPEPLVTRDEADQAAHYITELRRTVGDLQDRQKGELAPFQDFIAQIKARFTTPIDRLTGSGIKLKAKAKDYLDRQKALAEAEERRQREERIAAERKAEAARRAAEEAGRPPPPPVEAPPPPRRAPEPPTRLGGRGRAVVQRTHYSAKIVDYARALDAAKDDDGVKAAVQSLANARARASMVRRDTPDMTILLPGTEIATETRV